MLDLCLALLFCAAMRVPVLVQLLLVLIEGVASLYMGMFSHRPFTDSAYPCCIRTRLCTSPVMSDLATSYYVS